MVKLSDLAQRSVSALGQVDAAFEIANEFLLFRRPVERQPQAAPQPTLAKSKGWRFTPWLFIPPTKAMRIDPRFVALCEGLGLTEYWGRRHTGPERFLIEA